MSVQIKFTTPAFHIVGDGVATSANGSSVLTVNYEV